MLELSLPHLQPIRFAKKILSSTGYTARVVIEFDEIPSLAMMVEASAQSTAAFSEGSSQKGYLAGMKSVKLLSTPKSTLLEVEVTRRHTLENMTLFDFMVYEQERACLKGSLTIVLE